MSDNFWDSDDNISEFDLLQNSMIEPEEQVIEYEDIDDDTIENTQEESAFELSEDEVSVVYNARLRLEQARLYEMLINHNLFDGIDADPQAIQNVQGELKEYIVYRLDILLGLRKPKTKAQETVEASDDRLNDVEVDFLKQLAYKGTRGASVQSETPTAKPKQSTLNSMTQSTIGKKTSLKTLASPKQIKKQIKKKVETSEKTVIAKKGVKKSIKKQKSVVKTNKSTVQQQIKSKGRVRNLTPQEVDSIAREDLKISKGKKQWGKMSTKEKAAKVREVNAKHAKAKVTSSTPIPDAAQLEMHYMSQQQNRLNGSGDETAKFNTMVANILANKKQLGE